MQTQGTSDPQISSNAEAMVDNLVSFLLPHFGIAVGGLFYRPKPKLEFQYNGLKIVSETDYGIGLRDKPSSMTFIEESKKAGVAMSVGMAVRQIYLYIFS